MRSPRLLPLALSALVCAGTAACQQGASPASGVTAFLRVTNGQYEPGELFADSSAAAPTVDSIKSANTHVFPGAQGRSVTGSLSGTAKAVLIGLEGDSAHWLVPIGAPDLELAGNFTFGTSLSFSPGLPPGERALRFRAIDADGQIGPAQALTLKVEEEFFPPGKLVIQLEWDTEADLDLHVRIPNPGDQTTPYFDVWAKAPRGLPPRMSGEPAYTEAELAAGGRLLFDSNAGCTIDGARREQMVFPMVVPPGEYEVRVDAFSLCGEAAARWDVIAYTTDPAFETLAHAAGQLGERDTVSAHVGGSGTLAFTFTP